MSQDDPYVIHINRQPVIDPVKRFAQLKQKKEEETKE